MNKCLKELKEFIPADNGEFYIPILYDCGKCKNCIANKIGYELIGEEKDLGNNLLTGHEETIDIINNFI